MIQGIKIEFKEEDNRYFENEWNNNIEYDLLILSLLETVNDICIEYNLNTNEQLQKYMTLGSIDNYNNEEEIRKKEEYKTF